MIISTSGGNNSSSSSTTSTGSNTTSTSSNTSGDSGSTTGSGGLNYGYDYTTGNNNNSTYTGVGQTYGTGGSTTTNTDLGNPIIINPVPPCPTCPQIDEDGNTILDDCNQLKKISSNANIKSRLKLLRGKTSEAHETAVTFFRDPLTNGLGFVNSQGTNGTNSEAPIQYNSTTVGTSHVHQWGIFPMFSPGDLFSVCAFANTYVPPASDQPAFELGNLPFNIMVCESQTETDLAASPYGYAYIVVPNDIEAFKAHLTFLEDKRNRKELNETIEYLFSVPTSSYSTIYNWNTRDQDDLAKVFLKYINNTSNDPSMTNFDVSLYRIKFDANKNITGNWEQLSLQNNDNGTGMQLVKTPCNN